MQLNRKNLKFTSSSPISFSKLIMFLRQTSRKEQTNDQEPHSSCTSQYNCHCLPCVLS
uniref:Uncharacterized protein n=1 Tax=Rhizophora mucronata TaxID=61149 RepID=A0A2P2IJY0_RHIMU